MSKNAESLSDIQREAQAFQHSYQSVMLATSTAKGCNDCSYTPYILDQQRHLIIFVSQLAPHTQNLQENGQAGLLFIEDESKTRNIYARKRLSLNAIARLIYPDDPNYADHLEQLAEVHGKMVNMLRQLPDFLLFELIPHEGRFVRGFGDAWDLKGPQLEVQQLSTG